MAKGKNISVQYAQVIHGDYWHWHEEAPNHGPNGGELFNRLIQGDAITVLSKYPPECINLIVTSPPYADSRKKTYGGIHPDNYVKWFLPFVDQFYRVLSRQGSFVLNIKEKVVDSERNTYVLELIMEMRKRNWFWTEEYIWHKKNCYPGKWPNRFRDAWERCLHFN